LLNYLAVGFLNVLAHHEEDMELPGTLIRAQTTNVLLCALTQRSRNGELCKDGLKRYVTANRTIAAKRHMHLRSYRLGGTRSPVLKCLRGVKKCWLKSGPDYYRSQIAS